MSTVALPAPAVRRPAISPWIIAAAVVIPAFMEVLDTTIANVALRYIAGGLAVAQTDSEWVITSYLAANAIILPISGWLSAHLGRRNYFLLSIAVFTLASALCGMATSLVQIILFRVIQGLAGGGLQPSSQGILIDSFPPEKQGAAQTLFGIAALIGPIVGPTLGGWLVVRARKVIRICARCWCKERNISLGPFGVDCDLRRWGGGQPKNPVAVRPIEVAVRGHRQTVWRLLQHHLVVATRLADPEDHWVRVAVAPAGCDVQKAIGPFDHPREVVAVEKAVRVLRR